MNENILQKIAKSYHKLLTSIDWKDEILTTGLKEGLNKFLSNAFLSLNSGSKYMQGDFYSKDAITKVKNNDFTNLIYEHMVPKNRYIQKPCQEKAKKEELTIEFIVDLLNKYWKIAVITKDEDKSLSTRSMPKYWDKENIFLRYQESDIKLIQTPLLSNEEMWDRGLNLTKNGRSLKNTDGSIGKFDSHDKGIVIRCNGTEKIYAIDEDILNIINDGWIID